MARPCTSFTISGWAPPRANPKLPRIRVYLKVSTRPHLLVSSKSFGRRRRVSGPVIAAANKEEVQFTTLQTVQAAKDQKDPNKKKNEEKNTPLDPEDFTVEVTPEGYMLQEVSVPVKGKMEGREPEWFRFRPEIGVVGERKKETFVLKKTLSAESVFVEMTLERPIGVIFTPDTQGRVRVAELVAGYEADRLARKARVGMRGVGAALEGDVLRAFTCTVLDFPLKAQLLGDLEGTKRKVVLYGADEQKWRKTAEALRLGLIADGPLTLILERPPEGSRFCRWTPVKLEVTKSGRQGYSEGGQRRRDANSNTYEDATETAAQNDEDGKNAALAVGGLVGTLVLLLLAGSF